MNKYVFISLMVLMGSISLPTLASDINHEFKKNIEVLIESRVSLDDAIFKLTTTCYKIEIGQIPLEKNISGRDIELSGLTQVKFISEKNATLHSISAECVFTEKENK